MNFAFTEEQEELRSFIRSFMEEKSAEATVRELMETEDGFDAAVWSQMAEQLGLQSMIIPEEYGGQGFGYVELGIALEEMGRSLLCAPFFSTVVLAGNAILHSGNEQAKSALLPGIADGSTIATLALAEANGRWDAEGVTVDASGTADGSTIELLDETADCSTEFAPANVTVTAAGDYKFVFVSGTFDYTFGRALGASLYIDDIDVETANGPEVVVEYINVRDQESANTAIGILETASEQVATFRAYVGALQNRLTSAMANLTSRSQNQLIARGRIEDADFARESVALSKQQILSSAASQMLLNAQNAKAVLLSLI